MSIRIIFKNPMRCFECSINYFWDKMYQSINLLEISRIQSFFFDLKYLSQNSINFNMLGVFWSRFQNCPWICILSKIWRRYWGFYTAKCHVGHHCTKYSAVRAEAEINQGFVMICIFIGIVTVWNTSFNKLSHNFDCRQQILLYSSMKHAMTSSFHISQCNFDDW